MKSADASETADQETGSTVARGRGDLKSGKKAFKTGGVKRGDPQRAVQANQLRLSLTACKGVPLILSLTACSRTAESERCVLLFPIVFSKFRIVLS